MSKDSANDVTTRLARDLREDLGARLLNQLHEARDETAASNARTLLGELRAVLDALDPRRYSLQEALDQWHGAFLEQCAAAGIRASLQVPEQAPALQLTPLQRTHPRRILAEFLDNAARHARPQNAWLEVSVDGQQLNLRCRHDGRGEPPTGWRAARGLRNQQLRAQDLDATLVWEAPGPDMIELRFSFAVGSGEETR